MKYLCALSLAASLAALTISIEALVFVTTKPPEEPGIRAGQIRYHNGKPCIVERITVDPETQFLIVDESLLDQL